MSAASTARARKNTVSPARKSAGRSPLDVLLHALNQPLTGLQCSLEVTLAAPRSNEHYVKSLRDGLALTERMRMLVEAVREVVEIEESKERGLPLAAELASMMREAVEELKPVAEEKRVELSLRPPHSSGGSFSAAASAEPISERQRLGTARSIFRLLESTVALSRPGTALQVELEPTNDNGWIRLAWQASLEAVEFALPRPELGLLLAQAYLEKSGAVWQRQRTDHEEILIVRLPARSPTENRQPSSESK